MNNQLIIGGTIAVILLILVAILILKKKEKFTLNANGSESLPGGSIIKWGLQTTSWNNSPNTPTTVTFPVPFPNKSLSVTATSVYTYYNEIPTISVGNVQNTSFSFVTGDSSQFYWMAIGN